MANQDQNLNYAWQAQKLGATAGQSGYAEPGAAPATGTVSTAEQVSAGAPSPLAGNVTQLLTNPGYGNSGAAVQPGSLTAPTVPTSGSGIALNPSGLNASVIVATGAGVTVTQVAVAPAGSSTFQNLNVSIAASSSGSFQCPPAGQVKITYAGGTPTWAWTAVN